MSRRLIALLVAFATSAATLLVLDLLFLGLLAKPFYDEQLGALRAPSVVWPAAALFYTMYLGAITSFAVAGAHDVKSAFRRGAGLGFVAYATYELTNWAVIAGWPPALVPVDLAWGVVLTSCCSAAARVAYQRVDGADGGAVTPR